MTTEILELSGPDATAFLQSQLTADITAIEAGRWTWAGYCNPKGRLVATLILAHSENGILVAVDGSLSETVKKRLTLYRMRARVQIDSQPDSHLVIHLEDSHSNRVTSSRSVFTHAQLPLTIGLTSAIVGSPNREAEDLLAQDIENRIALIRSGVPLINASASEVFIPQSINLDLAGGVSFQKGCYPGQEIVARVRYLGKTKQRMILLSSQAQSGLVAGAKTTLEIDSEQYSAEIVDSVWDSAREREWILASVPAKSLAELKSRTGLLNGMKCSTDALPYPVLSESD